MRFLRPSISMAATIGLLSVSLPLQAVIPALSGPAQLPPVFETPLPPLQPPPSEAGQWLQQGLRQFREREFQAAIQSWRQALSLSQANGDRKGQANALGNLGNAYYSLGQYTTAIEFYQQALPMFRALNDRKGETLVLTNLGYAHAELEKTER